MDISTAGRYTKVEIICAPRIQLPGVLDHVAAAKFLFTLFIALAAIWIDKYCFVDYDEYDKKRLFDCIVRSG